MWQPCDRAMYCCIAVMLAVATRRYGASFASDRVLRLSAPVTKQCNVDGQTTTTTWVSRLRRRRTLASHTLACHNFDSLEASKYNMNQSHKYRWVSEKRVATRCTFLCQESPPRHECDGRFWTENPDSHSHLIIAIAEFRTHMWYMTDIQMDWEHILLL